jgi:hypothetical protein
MSPKDPGAIKATSEEEPSMRSPFRGQVAAATMFVLTLIPLGAFAAQRNESPTVESARVTRPEAAPADEGTAYTAERAIVRDEKTGSLRKPTPQETADLVVSLKKMTNRSGEGLKVTTTANGGAMVDLDGQFQMVVLARPNGEGGYETLCVSTFEEGAEFLGLRVEASPSAPAKPDHRTPQQVEGGQQ